MFSHILDEYEHRRDSFYYLDFVQRSERTFEKSVFGKIKKKYLETFFQFFQFFCDFFYIFNMARIWFAHLVFILQTVTCV